jgi:hypothetical protein
MQDVQEVEASGVRARTSLARVHGFLRNFEGHESGDGRVVPSCEVSFAVRYDFPFKRGSMTTSVYPFF